jgi:hypothetical protein
MIFAEENFSKKKRKVIKNPKVFFRLEIFVLFVVFVNKRARTKLLNKSINLIKVSVYTTYSGVIFTFYVQ